MKHPGLLFSLTIVLLTVVSCASMQPVDKTQLLRTEWERWQNFEAQGVVQLTNSGLTMRRMFVLSKTPEAMRFDILSGGVLAANPEPLISVYYSDYLAIQCPQFPKIEILAQMPIFPEKLPIYDIDRDSLFTAYADSIINHQELNLEGLQLKFNSAMQLEKIIEPKSGMEININRNSQGDPDKVKLAISENTYLLLLIDSISYGNAQIEPLPPNPKVELPEDWKQMFKSLLE
ncbi:hypothetical protein [Candidatus Syntrophosphaera thermopropionivorans]|jgi:hypothetical protein|uniref:Uncharacterized protein n=1 Tax=Candidatus Syntrophosphaera thermopropionivorans TaxID=2593015 RepID=A0AC61QIQ0_9BACT|nr:hypothetical protein [Candidatus Syntrophosphaera thermopropionivorans]TDF72849.1 hypothetical protein E0946_05060 [Candidatus Syntrophosphaera thermopropionivorans]